MRGQWVGPMPLETFFDEFLPLSESDKQRFPHASIDSMLFKAVSEANTEKDMYSAMLIAIENSNLIPDYQLIDTSSKPDPHGDQPWHIDLTCYKKDVDVSDRPNHLDKAEFAMELKSKDSHAPFGDPTKPFILPATYPTRTRGQLLKYASQFFNHQHRTHLFTVFIAKTKACFLYYDRSGVVVSEYFHYGSDSKPLIKFLWYFTHLTDTQKGRDPTVCIAPVSDARLYWDKLWNFHRRIIMTEIKGDVMKMLRGYKTKLGNGVTGYLAGDIVHVETCVETGVDTSSKEDLTDDDWDTVWDYAQSDIEKLFNKTELKKIDVRVSERMPCATRDTVIIEVPNGDKPARKVIGQGFPSKSESLTGRLTRAWPVMDVVTKKLYYLKDSWRPCLESMREETVTLKELNDNGVPHVPALECGGDLEYQKTRSDTFAEASWVLDDPKPTLTPRAHHRFLVDFIGRPLKHFSRSKQMLQATYDAFTAHRVAWEKCGILHRDISGNNVMLDRWGRGVLNDWDLAKTKEEMKMGPRAATRTGTWYFMSTLLLQRLGWCHDVQDDLESFFWLILFHVLSYLSHNHTDDLGQTIQDMFQACEVKKGRWVGGDGKMKIFNNDEFITSFEITGNDPFQQWITDVYGAVEEWIEGNATRKEKRGNRYVMVKANTDLSRLKLYDHNYLASVFEAVLASPDWPIVKDTEKVKHKFPGAKDLYGSRSWSNSTSASLKRSSTGDLQERRSKRIKASVSSGMIDPIPEEVEYDQSDHD